MNSRRYQSRSLVILAGFVLSLSMAVALPTPAAPLVTALPVTVPPPAQPLTVDDAVAFALQYNPAVTLAEQNVSLAKTQVGVARAGGSPNIGVGVTANWTANPTSFDIGGGDMISFPALTAGAQLTVTQPIWPPTQWTAPLRIARAGVGASTQALLRSRQQTAYFTRQAFYQMLSAQELLQVADDTLIVAQTQLKLAEATVAAGTAAPLDVKQAQAVLSSAEVNKLRAENGVAVSRAALAVQLGLPASTPIDIVAPTALPAPPTEEDALVKQALAQRPELAQINFQREQVRGNMQLTRLEQLPIVSVQGSYGQTITGGNPLTAEGLTASAALQLNLANGGRTTAEMEGLRIQLAELDTTARQIELGITLEVRQAILNLRNALDQLVAAQRQLDAANEALRISQIRYEAGEGIILEVQQAQLAQTQAKTSLEQARFQARIAAAQLDFALGAPVQ
ncbi:MAG: TolC family protein [Armatimonadota bacterium]